MKKSLFYISFLSFYLLGGLCNAAKAEKKSVFIEVAKNKEIFDTLVFPIQIRPAIEATILSETQGVLRQLPFSLGQKVNKNQNVARVKNTDPVYAYKAVSHPSPVGGVISQIHATEGTMVSKGQKILTITNPNISYLVVEVTSSDLPSLNVGQKGEVEINGQDKKYPIKILGISPVLDPATGTASAQLALIDKEKVLPIGSIGKVKFKTNYHQGISLPKNLVSFNGQNSQVKIVEKIQKTNNESKSTSYTVKKVDIELGKTRRGIVEVLKGLKNGQWVVKRSSGFLKEGGEVDIKNLPKKIEKDHKAEATEK